ncbi:hypothetical protein M9H77_11511 [Catharanthus roseus]|uniref:Uncharacterized protein n=1 Tax=Catharanthus roseus TaxID=4058 RepID=A0ACC0BEU6_CATRO|nr:hypothetical protein M9H77_11511 [Catharanthus roseus]
MDSKTKDVIEDLRSHTTKFSYMHNSGQNEKASVSLSKKVKREHVHKRMEDEDSDFLKCLNAEYMSILDDPKPGFSIGCDENDLDGHAKTEGIEFQSNYDSDYKLFFENMRLEGSNVIYQYKNGASVVYDGLIFLNSEKNDNVVSKKQKYTDAIQHETTSKGSKDVNTHCGSPQQTMSSNFRVQILEILRKPYDKEEHERLMQEITKRKPQFKHRDLRSGGVKFYPSDKMGKSLLDHHLVLKRKIEEAAAANNHLKQLNLLRGFFFWLQNLTDDESFIPWNDKECVDVQPKVSKGFNCLIP